MPVANMSFNAIRENKILAEISGFTVHYGHVLATSSLVQNWLVL